MELLVLQSNLYSQQNGRNLVTNVKEMKASIGVNYFKAINPLPNIPLYWNGYHFIANIGIQNIFTRSRFQEILQNLHFSDNSKQDENSKGYKVRLIINHLNRSFQASYSNEPEQSIDEHMTKFKRRSSMRQYLKMKPIKWGFKWWFRCVFSTGYGNLICILDESIMSKSI